MKFEINLNETVEVKLTQGGAQIYNARYKNLNLPDRYEIDTKVAGETLRIQLWNLMEIFGPYTGLGMHPHFEGLMMTIEKDVS
jgi:hypothetical protein